MVDLEILAQSEGWSKCFKNILRKLIFKEHKRGLFISFFVLYRIKGGNGMVQITKKISPYNHSSGNDVKYIVMHDTGNYKDTAEANANYFYGGDRQASAHYFVDEKSIYQVVEESNASWHCGDGGEAHGIGNHNSIGIEMCNSGGCIANATINNTLELVRKLMSKYKLSADKVVRHYDASRKKCPGNMAVNDWAKWKAFKLSLTNGSSSVENSSEPYIGYGVVTASTLNVRKGASASSTVIGSLIKGARVKICSKTGNWYDVYFGNAGGYVSADYIAFEPKVVVEVPKVVAPTIMYRVILDGKQVLALSDQEKAIAEVKNAIVNKQASKGSVQRNTDNKDVFTYSIADLTPIVTSTPKNPIVGGSSVVAEQMATFVLNNNPKPELNCSILELANLFLEEGNIEGIRGDVAFSQAIIETGFFKFGGDVTKDQNNYCGLGTTGGGVKGAGFDSPRLGVRAQIQHLKAYASKEALKQECVDPRYKLVTKGIAPNWEDLNGRWAVPGTTYGQDIIGVFNRIKSTVVIPEELVEEIVEVIPTPEVKVPVAREEFPKPFVNDTTFLSAVLTGLKDFIISIFNKIKGGK